MKIRHRAVAQDLTDALVATVAIAGVLAAGAIAPNLIQLFAGTAFGRPSQRVRIGRALVRAERRGFVTISGGRRSPLRVRLTDSGRRHLARRELEGMGSQKPARWDGRWRLIIFDIPEERRSLRDALRESLHRIGFLPLQQSVWLYPYDCRDIVELIRAAHGFHPVSVRYLVVSELEDDRAFRWHFDV